MSLTHGNEIGLRARMGSPNATAEAQPAGGVREIRRLETRARLFDAALAEIGRSGVAGADVSAIASAAGVVRGTFYFHFPTKEGQDRRGTRRRADPNR
jgi:AcrR family transcriptional regulator